jgi:hypothetical protein
MVRRRQDDGSGLSNSNSRTAYDVLCKRHARSLAHPVFISDEWRQSVRPENEVRSVEIT